MSAIDVSQVKMVFSGPMVVGEMLRMHCALALNYLVQFFEINKITVTCPLFKKLYATRKILLTGFVS